MLCWESRSTTIEPPWEWLHGTGSAAQLESEFALVVVVLHVIFILKIVAEK